MVNKEWQICSQILIPYGYLLALWLAGGVGRPGEI